MENVVTATAVVYRGGCRDTTVDDAPVNILPARGAAG